MDYLTSFGLAFSMSVDAMCAATSDGIKESKMPKWKSIFIPFTLGFFQFIMPVVGYFLAYIFKDQIISYIPWIAFGVLLLLGLKSIYDGIKETTHRVKEGETCEFDPHKKISFIEILIQDIGTSIDALTIGFISVDLTITDAMITFVIIGVVTFLMSLIALLLGKKIGTKIEKNAPFVSGAVFILLAIKFMFQALNVF